MNREPDKRGIDRLLDVVGKLAFIGREKQPRRIARHQARSFEIRIQIHVDLAGPNGRHDQVHMRIADKDLRVIGDGD